MKKGCAVDADPKSSPSKGRGVGEPLNTNGWGDEGDAKNCSIKGCKVVVSGLFCCSDHRLDLTRGERPSGLTSGPENRSCSSKLLLMPANASFLSSCCCTGSTNSILFLRM